VDDPPGSDETARGLAFGVVTVVAGVVCLAAGSSIVKWSGDPGSVVGFWRLVGASVAWIAVILGRRRWRSIPLPTIAEWRLAVPAGVCFGANIALFYTAVTKTSIAHAEFIAALSPLLLVPAGALLFGEHPNWRALSWGAVSLVGVAIVLAFGPAGDAASATGDLIMLTSLCSWTGYLLATKRARRTLDVVGFMACAMPVAAIAAAPFALLIAGDEFWSLSARGWSVVVLLTFLTGMIAHGLLVVAQRYVPLATIGILQVGQPAIAVVWGLAILGEQVRLAQVPGMVLVVAGLAAFALVSQRVPRPPVGDPGKVGG
jgi:drug/metabolite transporter (DMT)-like permease